MMKNILRDKRKLLEVALRLMTVNNLRREVDLVLEDIFEWTGLDQDIVGSGRGNFTKADIELVDSRLLGKYEVVNSENNLLHGTDSFAEAERVLRSIVRANRYLAPQYAIAEYGGEFNVRLAVYTLDYNSKSYDWYKGLRIYALGSMAPLPTWYPKED